MKATEKIKSFEKYEVVRIRHGCIWYYGVIMNVADDGFYPVSYGTSIDFENYLYNAIPFDYIADVYNSEISHLYEFKNNKYHGRNIDEIRMHL